MQQKFRTLESNHTYDIVPFPPHKKTILCKWVYKIKQRSDGTIERYKSRLVIKEGVDYHETFSPVVELTTVKYLFLSCC